MTKPEGVKTQRSVTAHYPGLLQASLLYFFDLLTAISIDFKVCSNGKILLLLEVMTRAGHPGHAQLAHSTLHYQDDHLQPRAPADSGGWVPLQDAREYFQYLLEVMTRAERSSMQRLGQPLQPPTAHAFQFELEDRIQCVESGRLSYKRSLTNVLAMDIPVDAATNKEELEDFQVQSVQALTCRTLCPSRLLMTG